MFTLQFGIHNPSFLFPNGETRIFDGLKRRAQWAEAHGFVWFDVMDHMIQVAPGVGMVSAGAYHYDIDYNAWKGKRG